jgi:hypothetical protein
MELAKTDLTTFLIVYGLAIVLAVVVYVRRRRDDARLKKIAAQDDSVTGQL